MCASDCEYNTQTLQEARVLDAAEPGGGLYRRLSEGVESVSVSVSLCASLCFRPAGASRPSLQNMCSSHHAEK